VTDLPVFPFDPEDHGEAILFLERGEMTVLGRIQGSSNVTLAVEIVAGDARGLAVYKPIAGERPLFDFATGTLHRREVACYRLAELLGWHLVPPTVLRVDAPGGEGSVQLFVPHDPERTAFTLFDERPDEFRRIVVLDLLANNADRKAGHVVLGERDDRLWAIDNGLTFHVEEKLRTVLWPFAGEPLDAAEIAAVAALRDRDAWEPALSPLLDGDELDALEARIRASLAAPVFPDEPEDRYPYPWPPI
jgi:uncharacterized repeat protein (TIGR03843 family)